MRAMWLCRRKPYRAAGACLAERIPYCFRGDRAPFRPRSSGYDCGGDLCSAPRCSMLSSDWFLSIYC